MKQNLENNIKESLKEFELPYDSAAWDAMSKKLDQRMPTTPKSNLKWYLGGAAAIAIIATTVTFWPSTTSTEGNEVKTAINNTDTTTQSKEKDASTISTNGSRNTTDNQGITNENNSNVITNTPSINNTPEKQIKTSTPTNAANPLNDKPTNTFNNPLDVFTQNGNGGNGNGAVNPTPKEVKIQSIENVCIGEATTIVNKNDVNLIILDPNNTRILIKANKSTDFTALTDGKHEIGYLENGNFISKESFIVLSAPKADFLVDDQNTYENGIPSIDLSAITTGISYTWDFEKQAGNVNGKSVSVHYFYKGNYAVTLTVQGSNGCTATETKSIQIEDDYNLMAVTGFDPMSNDIRINTFVPYALTQRSVDFNMIIIDPKDGNTIFETNDATKPWTGIDRRNGQLVKASTVYIWKVNINNPVKGEPTEYKGTITRL